MSKKLGDFKFINRDEIYSAIIRHKHTRDYDDDMFIQEIEVLVSKQLATECGLIGEELAILANDLAGDIAVTNPICVLKSRLTSPPTKTTNQ